MSGGTDTTRGTRGVETCGGQTKGLFSKTKETGVGRCPSLVRCGLGVRKFKDEVSPPVKVYRPRVSCGS